jgi:hypothetical protein
VLDDLRQPSWSRHLTSSTAAGRRKSVGYPRIIEDGGHVLRLVCDWLAALRQREKQCQSKTSCSNLADCQCGYKRKPDEKTGPPASACGSSQVSEGTVFRSKRASPAALSSVWLQPSLVGSAEAMGGTLARPFANLATGHFYFGWTFANLAIDSMSVLTYTSFHGQFGQASRLDRG